MGAAVVWNLVSLRAETRAVSYLDDSSLHEQMVRFATAQWRGGHLPLTSWFPYLGLGSPQFLHYQSLGAMLAGLLGLVTGPDAAFRLTLYLLLSFWPVSVYLAARWLGSDRGAAAASAAMSPFLVSAAGVGYEQHAYVWTGYGLWAQLWAAMTLPLAWGAVWRALRERRGMLVAVALVSVTLALHFETGYLALLPLALWPLAAAAPFLARARRAAAILAGSLLAAAWVLVPLLDQRAWAATNESLRGTPQADGYGAPRVLGWMVSGGLLDHGRLPVVTLLAGLGLALACARWRRDPGGRALVAVLVGCAVLSMGRTTFGPLAGLIPGSGDIFFRRFMMGIQLAALLLAGRGAAWAARAVWWRVEDRWRRLPPARPAIAMVAVIVVLAPAWRQLDAYDGHNAAAIDAQRRADATDGANLDRVLAVVKAGGGGRVYAGLPSNWGSDFTVGAVPVFKFLESRDVDEVGYTLRTASLMTNPEAHFDERDPGDYALFGVSYLVLPVGAPPPVRASLVAAAGSYALWRTAAGGYVHVGEIAGSLAADRTDLGRRSAALLRSDLAQRGAVLRVAYGAHARAARGLPRPRGSAPGRASAAAIDLEQGTASATVTMRRAGVAVLSASFDPGWTATVGAQPRATEMIAPALVATSVPAGVHRVVFRYAGFRDYPALFALALATLIAVALADRRRQRR